MRLKLTRIEWKISFKSRKLTLERGQIFEMKKMKAIIDVS